MDGIRKNNKFKKSVLPNKNQDCDYINKAVYDRLHIAKKLIDDLGETLNSINVDVLVNHIKIAWSKKENPTIKQKIKNTLSLEVWGDILIQRKLKANQPGTAKWQKGSMNAIKKFNKGKDIKLYDITVTFLNEFQAHHEHIGYYLKMS